MLRSMAGIVAPLHRHGTIADAIAIDGFG